jgi:seryl-tRNA synthetase
VKAIFEDPIPYAAYKYIEELEAENERLREQSDDQLRAEKELAEEIERLRGIEQQNEAQLRLDAEELRAEVERLRNRVTRLRKAVNWLRGCFDPESWEYKRATVVLDEEAE